MKRHEALAPLSREHHNALILAQLLKKNAPVYKGLPTTLKEKARYAQQQFQLVLRKHFQQEEAILEKVRDCHADIKDLGKEIMKEHRELTELFLLIGNDNGIEDMMDKLGNALEKHIRKEERLLFPLLQQHCPEELLQEVKALLH